jgi:hypothetical protein
MTIAVAWMWDEVRLGMRLLRGSRMRKGNRRQGNGARAIPAIPQRS